MVLGLLELGVLMGEVPTIKIIAVGGLYCHAPILGKDFYMCTFIYMSPIPFWVYLTMIMCLLS